MTEHGKVRKLVRPDEKTGKGDGRARKSHLPLRLRLGFFIVVRGLSVFPLLERVFVLFRFPSSLGDFPVQFFRRDSDGDRLIVFVFFQFFRMMGISLIIW